MPPPFLSLSKPLTLHFASDRLEQVVSQLSQAIVSDICAPHPQFHRLSCVLYGLSCVDNRPNCLREVAYGWCSVICENYASVAGGEELLSLALEIGFRHLDPRDGQIAVELTHTKHHRKLADIIFESGDHEVIADLLCAWTSWSSGHQPPTFLKAYAGHLVNLSQTQSTSEEDDDPSSSQRLRRHLIRAVGLIDFQEFEGVGVVAFCGLLDKLCVSTRDIGWEQQWARLLVDTIKSSEGIQHLPHRYWELLPEFAMMASPSTTSGWSPDVIVFLEANQEWDKLEHWMRAVWMGWFDNVDVEDAQRATLLLFHQRPGAIQRLKEWMGWWSGLWDKPVPEAFQQICEEAFPKPAQQDAPYVSVDCYGTLNLMRVYISFRSNPSAEEGIEDSAHPSPPITSSLS